MLQHTKPIAVVIAMLTFVMTGTNANACFMRSPQPVQVWLDHITVDIIDQVAVKTYRCAFKNPNGGAIVGGTCYMELEPGAQIDNMSVLVDGKEMKAEILDVEKANQVFKDIVKNGGSPALLEYYGNQLIQTKIPNIAAGKSVMVKLTYTTVLKKKGDLIRLQMLNTNPKTLMQPLKAASVTVNIKSKEPIKNIYSPTHKIDLVEKKDWDISVTWKQADYLPKSPFVLYYQTSPDAVGASLISHREPGEEGYFMVQLSPTLGQGTGKITDKQILPKDVVFCVDTSGSMLKGKKMEQAKAALKYCVEHLHLGDRFNIIDFSTTARHFNSKGIVTLTEESRAKALKYVEKLHARGGTSIQEALELSLKHLNHDEIATSEEVPRLKMILFATDGLPTIGERNPQAILKTINKKNTKDVRLFVFGEGYDVNTKLLDFLALDHRGEADYILPNENITDKISAFFDRVGSPVMTDLEFDFEGIEVKEVLPQTVKDVFKGEQIMIYGRYNGHGEKTLKVTASVTGERKTFTFKLNFPEVSTDDRGSFVPRLWAGQKIDYLLAAIRKNAQPSPDEELVNEITRLAKKFGIITPYTSYLMADDIITSSAIGGNGIRSFSIKAGEGKRRFKYKLAKKENFDAKPASFNGKDKVKLIEEAQDESRDRFARNSQGNAASLYEQATREMNKLGRKGSAMQAIRYVGSRTFYHYGKNWQESVYDPAKHKNLQKVTIGSDEYFALLKQDKRVAKYLALENVILQVNKQWYCIQPLVKK